MSACALDRYSPSLFQSLPSVQDAQNAFSRFGGFRPIEEALAAVVAKHPDAAAGFGIQLLHRHSDLADNEVMVAFGAATLPMQQDDNHPSLSAQVHGTVWGLRPGEDGFRPLEFAHNQDGVDVPTLEPAFARDIAAVLRKFHLESVLGLALMRPGQPATLESTHGRANIVLPLRLAAKLPSNAIEVMWPLHSIGVKSVRQCMQYCNTDEKGKHIAWGHVRV